MRILRRITACEAFVDQEETVEKRKEARRVKCVLEDTTGIVGIRRHHLHGGSGPCAGFPIPAWEVTTALTAKLTANFANAGARSRMSADA